MDESIPDAEQTSDSTPHDVAERLRMTADEDLLLTAWQYRMMQRDVAASKGKALVAKRSARDEFRVRALEALQARDPQVYEIGLAAERAEAIRENIAHDRAAALQLLEEAGPALRDVVARRSRSMLLLIELCGFEPWPQLRWDKDVRRSSLEEFDQAMPALRTEDLESVSHAYKTAVSALASKTRPWGKIALVSAAGLGLGALTAGLAAPVVGALFGSAVLGYSGAAATSAGLAALGGGSIAAGGFGMAGGAAVIAGAGGVAGSGFLVASARMSGLTVGQVAADVIRLEVATRLVLLDVEGDDAAAKAVVMALRERVVTIGQQVAELVRRIDELRVQRDEALAALHEEREARVADEATIKRLTEQLNSRLHRTHRDEHVQAIDDEIDALRQQQQATELVSGFVRSRAEKLDLVA
ncbi:hypothetical protein [Nesterenkonia halotolerans]|uniref:Uncharacterized protein n=1 Tax=Nesterenkonia halotolerans TaxID=225325 RepID=A0ABR9J363_9MICC|nr:hypothetical protein [Nesterenkonia halotolerans]MBE1513443.1 hypothetical protein [Nesterenkonia halotolerans]